MQLPQRRLRFGIVAGLCAAAVACFATALVNGRPARAASNPTGEHLTYASPVEILASKDASQLYVLCQGTDQVRVLDVHMPAGAKSPMHCHPGYIIYMLTGGKARFTAPDGNAWWLQEITTRGGAKYTLSHAPKAQVLTGEWKSDKLQVQRPGRGEMKMTETISLEDKGDLLVIRTKIESSGDLPAREFKRAYRRVTD